jgi:hypothetical protein
MAINGIFIHRPECVGVAPSTQAHVAIRCCTGKIQDANMETHWNEAGINPKRMLYDSTSNDPAVTMYENASYFISAINNLQGTYGSSWNENPIIVNINQPHIDLMWVAGYLEYLESNLLKAGHPKTILFTTVKKWNSIQVNTDDGQAKLNDILNKAELMVSEYGDIANPTKPYGIGKVRWWEYKPGFFEFNEMGQFNHVVTGIPTDTEPETPPVIPVSSNAEIRLACLDIAMDIAIHNAPDELLLQVDALTQLADKLVTWVNK